MIKGRQVQNHEQNEEEMIPDEFSDDDVEDDVGYEEVEEKFQPRESISSRGGAGRRTTNVDTNKIQKQTRDVQPALKNYEQHQESHSPGDKSSSVITEVVENQVVYLDSEDDDNDERGNSNYQKADRDQQIQEYLNINKNDYVNKAEYQDEPDDEVENNYQLTDEQKKELDTLEARKQELLEEKEELEAIISDLEEQVEQALPVVEQALQSLRCLTKEDITNLRSYQKPPQKVVVTTEAVLMLLGEPTDWRSFQKVAHMPGNFLERLISFDKEKISDDTLDKLDDFIEENDLSNIELIAKTSSPAGNLAKWVNCMDNYAHINQTLKPVMDRIKEAQEILTQKIVEIQKIEQAQQDILNGKVLNQSESDIKHAGLQTSFDGKNHVVQYEILDENGKHKRTRHEIEADHYEFDNFNQDAYESASQLYNKGHGDNKQDLDADSLYYITNEIKKKDQSKKFVLWETNEMRNQWDDRGAPAAKVHGFSKTNSHQWTHEPSDKSVSVIDSRKSKGKAKQPSVPHDLGDAFAKVPKKDHFINNVFLQSSLQDRLEDQKKKEKAPWSHNSYNKNEKPKNYMVEGRPLFGGHGNHVQNISSGRDRIFYSSNIF